jgi:phosphatase NudJ
MLRTPVQVVPIVVMVVQLEERFLMIQELPRFQSTWYLPAGTVEPGEDILQAAVRETREEAGMDVEPRALLWMEDYTRINNGGLWIGSWRFILRAEARDLDQVPNASGDTQDAGWFTLDEIRKLPLRGPDALTICEAVSQGCAEMPIDHIYRRQS